MPSPTGLRVLTFNLLHDPASWSERATLVEAELLRFAPDIALLQEVAWPQEQATALAGALGRRTGHSYAVRLAAVVVPDRLYPGRLWQEGLAILSRFPILTAEEPDIAGEVHVCQRVRLDVASIPLDVYNLHLDPFSPEDHRAQLAALLALVEEHSDTSGVVLGGDLNATPESDAVALLTTRFHSAHTRVHGCEPDHTTPTPFGVRQRQRAGRSVIFQTLDYLFVSSHICVTSAELAFTRPAEHDPTLYPSDHYGIIAGLGWTHWQHPRVRGAAAA